MKISLYFSVILGITFLTLRFLGLFLDLTYNNLFLFLGLFFLVGIGLPLRLIERHKNRQNLRNIVDKYQQKKGLEKSDLSDRDASEKRKSSKKEDVEYPAFRSQKQGAAETSMDPQPPEGPKDLF